MSLHLVFSKKGFDTCLARIAEDDVIVLLGDAIYGVAGDTDPEGVPPARIFVLEDDANARGIQLDQTQLANYEQVVELATLHNPIVSWND